jgi:hypothetical protein
VGAVVVVVASLLAVGALVVADERWVERLAWLVDVESFCLVKSAQKDPRRWKGVAPLVAVVSVAKVDWAPRAESPTRRMSEHLVVETSQGERAAEPVEIAASKACSAWNRFACSMTQTREPAAAAAAALHVTKQTPAAALELVDVPPCSLGSRET